MSKTDFSDINIPELIADMWEPLTKEQREYLSDHFTIQNFKKNEVVHFEGETPTHLMCLLTGKVKIYKEGVGGRSQIIRMMKTLKTNLFPVNKFFLKQRIPRCTTRHEK